MKRTALRRKSPQKRIIHKNRTKRYQVPDWYKKLPYRASDHGHGAIQKRAWRVISQTYRKDDFERFGHYCPGCHAKLETWEAGQLGHWLRYSLCNSFFKWERVNMALICPGCNFKDDAVTLKRLGEELQRRYGNDVLLYIEQENQRHRGKKIEEWMVVDFVARLRPDLVE